MNYNLGHIHKPVMQREDTSKTTVKTFTTFRKACEFATYLQDWLQKPVDVLKWYDKNLFATSLAGKSELSHKLNTPLYQKALTTL